MKTDLQTTDGAYLMYVDGHWRPSDTSTFYDNVNPAHPDSVLGRVPEATSAEVNAAIESADRAFAAWRSVSGNVKTKLFLKVAELLERDYDEIVATMTREMGKTLFDSRLDLDEAIGIPRIAGAAGAVAQGRNVSEEHRRSGHGEPPRAARRCRYHHAVQLPDRQPDRASRQRARDR